MSTVRIRDLAKIGQIGDIPPFDLPPGALTETINVVCANGGVSKVPGFYESYDLDDATTNPDGHPGAISPAGLPVWMENWFEDERGRLCYVTEDERFFDLQNNGTFDEVTPGGLSGGGTKWDSSVFDETVVWTNSANTPYVLRPGDLTMVSMPGWPDNDPGFSANWTAEIIRPYKNQLIAMRMVKDGTTERNRVQWSDISDGTLPANWNELDPASLAGGAYITTQSGGIRDGLELNDQFIIYTARQIWKLTLTGGQFTMRLQKGGGRGLLARGCVVDVDNFHFCIGNGAFFTYDGSQIRLIGEDKMVDTFFSRLVRDDNIHLSHNPEGKRVRIFFQDDADVEYPNRCLIWDYLADVWTEEELTDYPICREQYGPAPATSLTYADVESGGPGGAGLPPGVDFRDANVRYSDLEQTAPLSLQALRRTPARIDRVGNTYLRDGLPYFSRVTRTYLALEDIARGNGLRGIKYINSLLPQMQGSGTVQFQFGSAMVPDGPISWGPEVNFVIGTDYKVDQRITGRYFCWRMTGQDSGNFTLTGFNLDVTPAGED